jgi:hypothetical protein
MLIKHMALLFFISSCALFKSQPSLKDKDPKELLTAVKLTGEGRGRLTLGQSQYLFGVDSILNENQDWILAVAIPLHGEEVMILPDLKKVTAQNEETESFEHRIQSEFHRLKLNKELSSQQFLAELRSLVRFILSPSWGQPHNCKAQQREFVCELDGEKYLIEVKDKEFNIIKPLSGEKKLQVVAKNLTDSFFEQTDIRLYSNEVESKNKTSPFSLELFWKN